MINEIKSKISGSIAQFDSTVVPSAPHAAINAFSVAPTEIEGNLILLPIFQKRFGTINLRLGGSFLKFPKIY